MEPKLITWINDELEKRGWSYGELARRSGITGAAISHLVNGRNRPGFELCTGVAQAFGVDPVFVLRLAELLPSVSPAAQNEDELIAIYRQLNETNRLAVRATARALKEAEAKYEAGGDR